MSTSSIRQETIRLQRGWSPAERDARAKQGRQRLARLEALIRKSTWEEPSDVWATGSMTAADLQRVAG